MIVNIRAKVKMIKTIHIHMTYNLKYEIQQYVFSCEWAGHLVGGGVSSGEMAGSGVKNPDFLVRETKLFYFIIFYFNNQKAKRSNIQIIKLGKVSHTHAMDAIENGSSGKSHYLSNNS